jgi:hypothetical protein
MSFSVAEQQTRDTTATNSPCPNKILRIASLHTVLTFDRCRYRYRYFKIPRYRCRYRYTDPPVMKCKLILRFMHYKFEFRNVRVWLVSIAVLEAMRPRPQLRGRGQGQWFEAEAMPFSGLEAEAEINIPDETGSLKRIFCCNSAHI